MTEIRKQKLVIRKRRRVDRT